MRIACALSAVALLAAGLTATSPPDPKAPPPKAFAVYHLGDGLPPPPPGFYRTRSLAMSPDERWIAVVIGAVADHAGASIWHLGSTLVLLPMQPSSTQPVQINLGIPVRPARWSLDSQSVAVQALPATRREPYSGPFVTRMYNLRGELIWTGPPSGEIKGFIQPGRLFAEHATSRGRYAGFDTIDVRSSAITSWPVSRHWTFGAVSSDRQLVAVFPDNERTKTLIVDYATGKVLRSMKNQMWTDSDGEPQGAPNVFFAEHGKAICFATTLGMGGYAITQYSHPICRDVDTGQTLDELKTVQGGGPADASSGATRMIVTALNSFPAGVETYSGTVVWDFRSGAEIAWQPAGLKLAPLGRSLFGTIPNVLMSSSGKYIALVRGDELLLYAIP